MRASPSSDSELKQQLGATVRRFRQKMGVSQQGLAERTHVSGSTVAAIEGGTRRPSILIIVRLAKAFGMTAADLLDEAKL